MPDTLFIVYAIGGDRTVGKLSAIQTSESCIGWAFFTSTQLNPAWDLDLAFATYLLAFTSALSIEAWNLLAKDSYEST